MSVLINELQEARKIEGQQTAEALTQHMKQMNLFHEEIASSWPKLRALWESQFRTRIQKVSEELKIGMVSEDRILQELLILAEKRDVAEELQRIESHAEALRKMLDQPPENVGKRLEFIVQELHREWTTLGNKIQNAEVSKLVMEAKLTLEKIREQSLNLV